MIKPLKPKAVMTLFALGLVLLLTQFIPSQYVFSHHAKTSAEQALTTADVALKQSLQQTGSPFSVNLSSQQVNDNSAIKRQLNNIQQLSHVDMTVLAYQPKQGWQVLASTLKQDAVRATQQALAQTYQQHLQLKSLSFGQTNYLLKTRVLHADKKQVVIVVMQSALNQYMSPVLGYQRIMMGLALLGFVLVAGAALYLSRTMTQVLSDMVLQAKQIAQGNYQGRQTQAEGELGTLAIAMHGMQEAVAQREALIHELAYVDELTGNANRLGLMQYLHQQLVTHEKTNQPLALLVFNLNGFKQINKTIGRAFGDEVLIYVANCLSQQASLCEAQVARIDADEFVVVLNKANHDKATQFAEKIAAIFATETIINDVQLDLQMAVGIALYPEHGTTEEALLHSAQVAQEVCKSRKMERVVYNADIEFGQKDSLAMVAELKEALKQNQLMLYLQPKIDLNTRKASGAEALIRWIHPERGMVFPDEFIPIAEHTGTIQLISAWMLEEACKVCALFKQQNLRLNVAVNLSTRDICKTDLPAYIQSLLTQYGIGPEALRIEITENSLMHDVERITGVVNTLADMGLHISIDDFGTGYSSFGQLRTLPVQALKVDKSFVMYMDKNPSDKAIVKSTIDLAHNLHLQVVAEGIENAEVLDQLTAMGCDEGVGFYIGKPMPVRDFGIWLERWENTQQLDVELLI